MDSSDWRTQLQADSRQRIVDKTMETLKRHFRISGPEGLLELKKIVVRFEEKNYSAATSQSDYLRKISLKMPTMETKSQNTGVANSLPSNSAISNQIPSDPASHSVQSQVCEQGQLPISLPNQSQAWQQLLSQNIQNTMASGGVQSSSSLPSAIQSVTGLIPTTMPNTIGQGSNLQSISGMSESAVGQGSNLQQQQQLLGAQSGVSNMQTHQQSLHLLQQAKAVGQQKQTAPASSTLMQIPGKQSESQPLQQQLMPQLQPQPAQLQHQLNQLQPDMQQRLHSSGLQPQNVIEQKQIQSQRILQEASSTSIDSTAQTVNEKTADWQEEAYQKIKSLKEMYLPDLNEMHQKICLKLQQHDSLAQQPKVQIARLKMMKLFLERIMTFLQVSKSNIPSTYKEKLGSYVKQIITFLNSNRPKKPVSSQQGQQQLQPSGGHTRCMPQQQQQLQSQFSQLQQHDNQMNSQMQPMNLPNSVTSMQQTAVMSMPHGSLSQLSTHLGDPSAQANMMSSLQPGSSMEMGQGSAPSSLQQSGVGPRQQNTVHAAQQVNMNTLSQNGVNGLQPNINPLQLNSNMLQQQHLKQQQEQQLLQSQQLKVQLHQGQMHQQLIQQQKQQILQQQHPQLQQQVLQQLQLQQQFQQQQQWMFQLRANHVLLKEIKEINQRLIDTVVDISDEDVVPTAVAAAADGGKGTIVKRSFNAVALSPNLKSQYASAQMLGVVKCCTVGLIMAYWLFFCT